MLELLDFRIATDRYGEVVAEMSGCPWVRSTVSLRFYVAYVAADGTVLHDNDFYQPVSVLWYPTTLWEPGTPVRIRTLPWTLEADQFVPLLGVYAGENWGEGEQLSITRQPTIPPFPFCKEGKSFVWVAISAYKAGAWQAAEPTLSQHPRPRSMWILAA